MRNDILFSLAKLTVLALVAILTGCGGGDGGGSDQNQSSTQKPDNSDGGQAAKGPESPKTAEKPAEKFTPEMVKAAMEAALQQLPDLHTKEEHASRSFASVIMMPAMLQLRTDELNENISGGKIDHRGLKVDAITVEALTKAFVAELPKAKKKMDLRALVLMSRNRAAKLYLKLFSFASGNDDKFPDSNKWCDAIIKDVGSVEGFYSPQHPDTAKLKEEVPKDKRVSHYAMNKAMSGKPDNDPEVVLVFECDLGWNGAGGLEDALKYMDKYKLEKIAVAKVDGSFPSVTKEEMKKLKWAPKE